MSAGRRGMKKNPCIPCEIKIISNSYQQKKETLVYQHLFYSFLAFFICLSIIKHCWILAREASCTEFRATSTLVKSFD